MKLRARRSGMYGFVINALLSVVAGKARITENWVWRYPKTLGGVRRASMPRNARLYPRGSAVGTGAAGDVCLAGLDESGFQWKFRHLRLSGVPERPSTSRHLAWWGIPRSML